MTGPQTVSGVKFILHIGAEKTGTTSIQQHLYSNRDALQKAGYHLLQSAGTHNQRALAAYALDDEEPDDFFVERNIMSPRERADFRKAFVQVLERELRAIPDSTKAVIISSEHFHSRLRNVAAIGRVRALLQPYAAEFSVIGYLREQCDACVSWYSTSIKYGETDALDEFMQRCQPQNYHFDYERILGNWSAVFGPEALELCVFERECFFQHDLLQDFLHRIDAQLPEKMRSTHYVDNESLSVAGQQLLLAINCGFTELESSLTPQSLMRMRRRCESMVYARLRGVGEQPPASVRDTIRESFATGNERVRLRYFPERERLFTRSHARTPTHVSKALVESVTRRLLFVLRWHPRDRLTSQMYAVMRREVRDAASRL